MRVSAAERGTGGDGRDPQLAPQWRRSGHKSSLICHKAHLLYIPPIFFLFESILSPRVVLSQHYLLAFLISSPFNSPFSLQISNKLIITLVAVISSGHTKWFPMPLHKLDVLLTRYTLIYSIAENCRENGSHMGTSYHMNPWHSTSV